MEVMPQIIIITPLALRRLQVMHVDVSNPSQDTLPPGAVLNGALSLFIK